MLIAAGDATEGGRMLIIGLDEENIRRLRNDEPIQKNLTDVPGLEDWTISILGPEDMARFIAHAQVKT